MPIYSAEWLYMHIFWARGSLGKLRVKEKRKEDGSQFCWPSPNNRRENVNMSICAQNQSELLKGADFRF